MTNEDAIKVAKIQVEDKELLYEVSNKMMMMRAQSLFTKEPDTIHWINQFSEKDCFIQ